MERKHENSPGAPPAQGLYDPRFEHDSCGIGLVCKLNGSPSQQIISHGLQILKNLAHRGACACDDSTGDGAGILVQLPDRFLRRAFRDEGVSLPKTGHYAAGLVFLPPDKQQRQQCKKLVTRIVHQTGQHVLGWRNVPGNSECLGPLSRHVEPAIQQIVIARSSDLEDQDHFERKLYVIRKQAENLIRRENLPQDVFFHIPSLSSRTMVYKGMFTAHQLESYYQDLTDASMESALAIVHQRYSTNTFPAWHLAQPFRFLAHNGEINTLRGNLTWLKAREPMFASKKFGNDMARLLPLTTPGLSDSACLDAMLELLHLSGRPLPHCIMMLIPEAWQQHNEMSKAKRAFYEYHAALMEPWDGPAAVAFTDGRSIGAVLDRNGLRPSRYTITTDGLVVTASESGVLDIPPESIREKGRLQPGRMFLADLAEGRIIGDEEIKATICNRKPYRKWIETHRVQSDDRIESSEQPAMAANQMEVLQQAFGYTREDLKLLMVPMARSGKEPIGSMGDDTPPAVLSLRPRLLYDYFRQLFAQVTNPPLDAIREALVTSLMTFIGPEKNLLGETPEQCCRLRLDTPILDDNQLAFIKNPGHTVLKPVTLPIRFASDTGPDGLAQALHELSDKAARAIASGANVLILSDRGIDEKSAPIPALLAISGLHHDLIRRGLRMRCSIVVESAEPREVHHFCCLMGYGANAVHPYLAYETIKKLTEDGHLGETDPARAIKNYQDAVVAGILKVMSKMGIATLQSYQGAQIFECLGLSPEIVTRYFTHTVSRIGGADLGHIFSEIKQRHDSAFARQSIPANSILPSGGKYQWRRDGEAHQYTPQMLTHFRRAVFENDWDAWKAYSAVVDAQNQREGLLRGLFAFKPANRPLAIHEVEPWTDIVKRFKTGAMSYGSISKEAHETLAIAMNRIGGRSNSGEGGEDPGRFTPDANGDCRNSAIKQVASGRFGVTSHYLINAKELQIKMAQGAKPGEGGQLPGFKVYPWIAKTRHSTPYVGLISPPPHHDIYSIEDLSQLIHDLKCANPQSRVSVKLVSASGVGTIAAGVAKGGADGVVISGESGGTGAAPLGAVRHCGLPWELGVPEAHQTLMLNGLRDSVVLECDGQLKTGRDIAIAALLGAQEFAFGTLALVALGCIMMRVCHLNTCPVGIATQDPDLRKKFAGKPEYVVNMMRFMAEELREVMAQLGIRTFDEMVGRLNLLDFQPAINHWKARAVDLSGILRQPETPAHIQQYCQSGVRHQEPDDIDEALLAKAAAAIENGKPVTINATLRNIHRTVGTRLSSRISELHGIKGLPENTITLNCQGTTGQSFMAFGARGITAIVHGDANDYFGKGLSGARLVIRPPENVTYIAEKSVIIGNAALYGATSGEAYIRGIAGERFCVRNSGATVVAEGTGDHACEYMTGGRVAILGPTGRNTAAGMSGGIAYILDESGDFRTNRCNPEMVIPEPLSQSEDETELKILVENHLRYTQSALAKRVLENWEAIRKQFIKIMPTDYKLALEKSLRKEPINV